MKEIWKDISNYEGLYQISNLGHIKSLTTSQIMKVSKNSCGYLKLSLCKNGKYKTLYVHRLVANAFIDNPYNKTQVNHIDGCKTNNVITNLEWCTPSENQKHAINIGIHAPSPLLGKTGSKHPCSRKIKQFTKDGAFVKKWDSITEASSYFKCNQSSIGNCLIGRSKTSMGYIWKYDD